MLHAVLLFSGYEPISSRLASSLTDARHPRVLLIGSQSGNNIPMLHIRINTVQLGTVSPAFQIHVSRCISAQLFPPSHPIAPLLPLHHSCIGQSLVLSWFFLQLLTIRSHQMPQVKVRAGDLRMAGQSLLTQGALPAFQRGRFHENSWRLGFAVVI